MPKYEVTLADGSRYEVDSPTPMDAEAAKIAAFEQSQKIANSARNAVQYSNESKKYYEWARGEISMFIQNNSKILTRQMAAQSAQQQSRR